MQRFVDAFFSRIAEFQNPSRHPKWQETNLAAEAPGWQRFKPAQDWLTTHAASPAGQVSMAGDFQQFLAQRRGASRRSISQAELEKLIQDFDVWRTKGGR